MDVISYIMSRKYVDDTVIGLGFLKGANATIKSIVHQDGVNIVTFEWTATDGTVQTQEMIVKDGTPIYAWESGESYNVGDIAIYNSAFYVCTVANSDVTFNPSKWNPIGSADSSFGIVDNNTLLPSGLSSTDRKLFYVINEAVFYLWNGTIWEVQERDITNAEIDALFE